MVFHGKIPYMDVGRLFDRTILFANTSEVEGFPNTFLQAWIRGTPVATMFDPDGLVARKGLGTSHASVEDMIEGVRRLLESAEAYAAAGGAARRFMATEFGEHDVLDPYVRVLEGRGDATGTRCPGRLEA